MRRIAAILGWWLLAVAAPAQKPAAGTIVEGEAGMRLDNAVTRTASTFWGAVLVAIAGKPVLAKGYGFADRVKTPIVPALPTRTSSLP